MDEHKTVSTITLCRTAGRLCVLLLVFLASVRIPSLFLIPRRLYFTALIWCRALFTYGSKSFRMQPSDCNATQLKDCGRHVSTTANCAAPDRVRAPIIHRARDERRSQQLVPRLFSRRDLCRCESICSSFHGYTAPAGRVVEAPVESCFGPSGHAAAVPERETESRTTSYRDAARQARDSHPE